jgi:hypothetical protein
MAPGFDRWGMMVQQILAVLAWVGSAAIVMAVAGAIVGEILRFLSAGVTSPRLAWLFGSLTRGEGFGLGLLIATFIVAAAYAAISGGAIDYGSAWIRYTIGAAVAFAGYGLVASRRST